MIEPLERLLKRQLGERLRRRGHSEAMVADARREARSWLTARSDALSRRSRILAGRTVVWTRDGRCELAPTEVALAGAGEVSIEVVSSAVSPGTERAQYLRLPNAAVRLPHRPGYSVAGTVLAAGPDVPFAPGDRVAAIGVPHASVATVPASRVFRVPEGVSLEAAALVRLGIVAAHGVSLARVESGEPVCVLGAGLVGALAQRLAGAEGAEAVAVVARSRRREDAARAGGAASFLVAGVDDERIFALAAGAVIEATGDPAAFGLAVEAAAPAGRLVLLGSPRGTTPDVPVDKIRAKRLEIVGAHVTTLEAEQERLLGERFLQSLADRRLRVDDLVETSVDPREAAAFYRELAADRVPAGAYFDWSRLPEDERAGRSRFLRLPDLSARGIDPQRAPLPARIREGDPFAGATGRLRIALLGCGDVAVRNAAAIVAAPNAELVACYDPDAALAGDLARRFGCEASPAAEGLLERRDVDAVFLAVPHHLHAPLALQAVARGRHVIVEKPPANELAAAVAMAGAAERAGVVLSVCFPHRYDPQVAAARRLIASGALGPFAGSLTHFLAEKPASYWLGGFSGRSTSDWRLSRAKAGGGVLIMNLCHYVDLVRYLVGVEAEAVTATLGRDGGREVEETAAVSIAYENGAAGSLFGSSAATGIVGRNELHVWGRDGHLALAGDARFYTVRAVDGVRTGRWQTLGASPPVDARAVYVSRLASAIDQGRPPDVDASDGLAVQAFLEAAYRSSETGRAVRPADLLEEVGA